MKSDNPIAVTLVLTAVSLMVVLTAGAGSALAQEARYCSSISGPACPEQPKYPEPWDEWCSKQSGWPKGMCEEGGNICNEMFYDCGKAITIYGYTGYDCDGVNTCSSPT